MLNKGPYIVDAIALLDVILTKMGPWHDKDRAMLPSIDKVVR